MKEDLLMDVLWKKLEVAVNTYGEALPVDAFLPAPEKIVEKQRRQREARRRRAEPVEELTIPDSVAEIRMDEAVEKSSAPPEQEATSLEEDLRRRLTGGAFADPEEL